MRSIAEQTDAELGGRWSVLVRQKRDHVALDRLLGRVLTTSGPEQDAILRRTARLVFPHAFAEETVLWPALRRSLPDGEALTLRVEQEHQEINRLWTALEAGDPSQAERQPLIERLVELLRQDVRDEEDALLPRLQETVDSRTLRRLGVVWEATRRTAPTRPHPVVSRRPPGNVLAALPLTALDRNRDGLDALTRRVPARLQPTAHAASRVLAGVAGRLERRPLMRRGEDASTDEA